MIRGVRLVAQRKNRGAVRATVALLGAHAEPDHVATLHASEDRYAYVVDVLRRGVEARGGTLLLAGSYHAGH